MKRRTVMARGAALASAALGGVARAATAGAAQGASPDALPALGSALAVPAVELFDGRRFEPVHADGKVLVVYWWASWCPFCALQSPHMEKLWQAGRGRGLQMLALSIDKQAADATAYLAQRGYTFPAGLFTPAAARVLPKPKGLPVTVVRGRDGRVVMAEAGQLFPEDVEQIARWL